MPQTRDICFACARAMNDLGPLKNVECTEGPAGSSQCSRCRHLNKVCINATGDAQAKFRDLAAELARPRGLFGTFKPSADVTEILKTAPADQDATVAKEAAKAEYKAEKLELLRRLTVAMEAIAVSVKNGIEH
ncbi:hypothetical protein PG989_012330 [Apiospora arundinis]